MSDYSELFRVLRPLDEFNVYVLVPASNFGDWDVLCEVITALSEHGEVRVAEAVEEIPEIPPRRGRPRRRQESESDE